MSVCFVGLPRDVRALDRVQFVEPMPAFLTDFFRARRFS